MSMSEAPMAASDATSRSRAVSVRAVDKTDAAGIVDWLAGVQNAGQPLGRANLTSDVPAPRAQRRSGRIRISCERPKSQ